MRFLADECCDAGLVEGLRLAGHDVLYAIEAMPGAGDAAVLERAHGEGRLLLTEDKDFGELVVRLQRPVRGVILLRFAVREEALKAPRLLELIGRHGERLPGAFVVLEADRVRRRPLEGKADV